MDFHHLMVERRPKLTGIREGMFGRMFPDLPPLQITPEEILAIGAEQGVMDVAAAGPGQVLQDNPRIPAGFAFFGQFIAHDITSDRSPLQSHEELDRNFRSPRLDLECVYGSGSVGQTYLFDADDPEKLLIGLNECGEAADLPRNQQGRAIVGDVRNDTHIPISQLHLAFLKLHNLFVDQLRATGVRDVFDQAQRLTRWHYQWVILHDYLPLIVGGETVGDILHNGSKWVQFDEQPFIPMEFAAGAFRFGHAQLRDVYELNETHPTITMFPDLLGMRPVPACLQPDWTRFFNFPGAAPAQPSIRLDAAYAHCLIRLPELLTGVVSQREYRSLACRDLLRALAVDLPSGETIARAVGVEPLPPEAIGLVQTGWAYETPLLLYILREAALQHQGQQLGELGGRLVAEVIIELLRADPSAYLNAKPAWRPTLPVKGRAFTLADLLRATGMGPGLPASTPSGLVGEALEGLYKEKP